MFSIENITDMWVTGTSKQEVAKQYLKDNNWWDILECNNSEEGYIDSYLDKV